MRQTIGIILLLISFVAGFSQTGSFERELASKIGICNGQNNRGSNYAYPPCTQCKLNFVALAPEKGKDHLFFMEASSPAHCGSGGCTGTVYAKQGNTYREIAHIFGFFEKAVNTHRGVPDLIYLHVEFPRHDYDNDGKNDKATIRVRYRWNAAQATFKLVEIMSIDIHGTPINPSKWRDRLITEWESSSPWLN